MTSVNLFPTFHYSQPEDYRFSHDSVFLARHVFEIYREEGKLAESALDLCAGCGIVGLDFLHHCRENKIPSPKYFDFIEVQTDYRPHFDTNLAKLDPLNTEFQFINDNYGDLLKLKPKRLYDLILCNPPYFLKGHGKLPNSDLKSRSKFFIDSDFTSLILFIKNCLSNRGKAYLLACNQQERKIDFIDQIHQILNLQLQVELVGDIRGTELICLSRQDGGILGSII